MKKIKSFSLEYEDDIMTGVMSVVTNSNEPVEIVKWDCKGKYPILGVIDDGDTSDTCFYDKNGVSANGNDILSIVYDDGEPEFSEFEKTYLRVVHRLSPEDVLPDFIEKNKVRENCEELFDVAIRQMKEYDKTLDFGLSNDYDRGYAHGARDNKPIWKHPIKDYVAQVRHVKDSSGFSHMTFLWNVLSDLEDDLMRLENPAEYPMWKRATEDLGIGCIVWDEIRRIHLYSDKVTTGQLYISVADILSLPGSPKV